MTLRELMRENMDVWGQSDFMQGLNDMFNYNGEGQFATAIVVGFHQITGHLAPVNTSDKPSLGGICK